MLPDIAVVGRALLSAANIVTLELAVSPKKLVRDNVTVKSPAFWVMLLGSSIVDSVLTTASVLRKVNNSETSLEPTTTQFMDIQSVPVFPVESVGSNTIGSQDTNRADADNDTTGGSGFAGRSTGTIFSSEEYFLAAQSKSGSIGQFALMAAG